MKNNDYPLVKNAQNNFFDSLIDDNNLLIIAGPCSVESYDTLLVMAKKLQKLGISICAQVPLNLELLVMISKV